MTRNSLNRHFGLSASVKALFLATFLVGTSLAAAAPTTEVRFFDDCTGEPLTLGSPNEIRIEVAIQNLDQNRESREPVILDLSLGVVEFGATTLKPFKSLKKKKVWPKNGQVSFQTKVHLKNAQILQAQVFWTQNKQVRSSVGTLLMPSASFEPFYKRVSEAQCSWGEPVQIESGYHFNGTADTMSIKKSYDWNLRRGRGHGYTEGPPAITGDGDLRFGTSLLRSDPLSGTPIGGISLWYFKARNTVQSQDEIASVAREWFLEPGQGGIFGTRWWFTRYQSEEYVLHRSPSSSSCWQWKVARRGYLDVGIPSVDFYVISENDSTDLKKAAEVIEKTMPALNTCNSLFKKNENNQSKSVITLGSTEEEILFFNADQE